MSVPGLLQHSSRHMQKTQNTQKIIRGFIKMKNKLGKEAGKLFFLCFIAYMFSYFGRYDFSACQNAMIKAGVIDLSTAGTIASAYFVCYGAGQLINGAVGVHVSPKYMIACGLFGVGIVNILMGICPWSLGLIIIWGLNGLFNSMLWSPIIRAFSEWMDAPSRERAGADISLTIPFGTLGSYVVSSLALSRGNWRLVFYISGALILLCGVVWTIGMGTLSEHIARMSAAANKADTAANGAPKKKSGLSPAVFFGTGLTLVAVSIIFNGALKEAVIQNIPQLMIDNFGVSDSFASLISTCVPLVGIAGPYAAIWLDKKFLHNECYTAAAFYGVSLISMVVIALSGLRSSWLTLICLALSTAAMWGVNTIMLTYLSYHYGSMGLSSAVSGTLNCFVYIGSAVCAKGYGVAISATGWQVTSYIWCGVAAAAVVASIAAGIVWKRKQPAV